MMTKDEFIVSASKSGYCNKKQAEEYCEHKGKEIYTDDDYIGVYRMVESQKHKAPGRPLGDGAYTTKRFFFDGGSEGNR